MAKAYNKKFSNLMKNELLAMKQGFMTQYTNTYSKTRTYKFWWIAYSAEKFAFTEQQFEEFVRVLKNNDCGVVVNYVKRVERDSVYSNATNCGILVNVAK